MAKVYYVTCSICQKEYYLEEMLYKTMSSKQNLKLKCPFCKKDFLPEKEILADKTN